MPKKTAKYKAALEQLARLNIKASSNQETDYRKLAEKGYQWDCRAGEWLCLDSLPAKPATDLTRVRVWAARDSVQHCAEQVLQSLTQAGFQLIEMSEPYPCRPPQQNESRIYLTLLKG